MLRHGARHDIYLNPETGLSNPFQDIPKLMKDWQDISESSWDCGKPHAETDFVGVVFLKTHESINDLLMCEPN